ncbi:type 1 periplasmic-binding domain-containing protein [Actinomadura napierensis]|uniref:hypothetical protein n=1 Tax=Actinomadura napierensis TaxID=267854 RepID=UPI0031D452C9
MPSFSSMTDPSPPPSATCTPSTTPTTPPPRRLTRSTAAVTPIDEAGLAAHDHVLLVRHGHHTPQSTQQVLHAIAPRALIRFGETYLPGHELDDIGGGWRGGLAAHTTLQIRHLAERGHIRIALALPDTETPIAAARVKFTRHAASELGIPVPDAFVALGDPAACVEALGAVMVHLPETEVLAADWIDRRPDRRPRGPLGGHPPPHAGRPGPPNRRITLAGHDRLRSHRRSRLFSGRRPCRRRQQPVGQSHEHSRPSPRGDRLAAARFAADQARHSSTPLCLTCKDVIFGKRSVLRMIAAVLRFERFRDDGRHLAFGNYLQTGLDVI